jgi:hypothetical protein
MDAMEILSTPVRADFEDYPAWHFDSKGVFSVKSAYIQVIYEHAKQRVEH